MYTIQDVPNGSIDNGHYAVVNLETGEEYGTYYYLADAEETVHDLNGDWAAVAADYERFDGGETLNY